MKRLLVAAFALSAALLAWAPAHAASINGMEQVAVCDPTTNQGLNCVKPASDGSLPTNEGAATGTSSTALAANKVICAAACKLASFNVAADSTLSGAAWWVMIYDATTQPADGAVTPLKCYPVASGQTLLAGAFPIPLALSTGAVIGVSTTGCFTKTASTHAFISGDSR